MYIYIYIHIYDIDICVYLHPHVQAVLAEEFASFVDLEMTLHVGAEELLPHFRRILVALDATPALYMGQDSPSMLEAESLARFSVCVCVHVCVCVCEREREREREGGRERERVCVCVI